MNLLPVVLPERTVALVLAVGWALVLFLAQGLVLALVVAALLRAWRDRSPELRYGVACAGLLAMALCPLVTTVLVAAARPGDAGRPEAGPRPIVAALDVREATPAPEGEARGATVDIRPGMDWPPRSAQRGENEAEAPGPAPIERPEWQWRWRMRVEPWLPALVAAWLAGVFALALRLVRGLIEVRSLTRLGVSVPTGELESLIGRLVERSGVRRPVRWFLSWRVEVPTVVGWLRPAVLIPGGSLARLTLRQLEALLAHEIAHIRRHDYVVNIIQVAVEALFYFHPAVWWVSRQIRIEREHCCDDLAAALCGGDRRIVARALFALEEQRGSGVLGVAASGGGGSLRQRVLRLMAPASPVRRPAEAGWAGAGLIAATVGLVAMVGLAVPTHTEARDNDASPSVHGRVLDDTGQPVAGTRVRLYRRESRWERTNRMVEEATAGPDGTYRLTTPLKPLPPSKARSQAPYVLVADHPGRAVGWKTVPGLKDTFEGDIILTAPTGRTIQVVDADGHAVADAKVTANAIGDPSSPLPHFLDHLTVSPEDGPLTAVTGADGRATFTQLPKTNVSFIAAKPGFARNYAFREQGTIHLTPGAAVSGTVTGPDGRPLAGVEVNLFAAFMWHFERTVTDAKGQYHFEDLKARGWDMSAWNQDKQANGQYKVWLEDDRFVMPTTTLTLEPNTKHALDIQAIEGGVIRVTLVEAGTNKPVANARITGFDAEPNARQSGRRLEASTDEQGHATFRAAPAKISLGLSGPPEGFYFEGDLMHDRDAHANFDFPGGEVDVKLVMPRIAGALISVSGVGLLPDGTPAVDANVNGSAGRFLTASSMSYVRNRHTDRQGIFTLEEVPAGRPLHIYAETPDRRFAVAATIQIPDKPDPKFQAKLEFAPTVTPKYQFVDAKGKPPASRKIRVSPQVAGDEFSFLRRTLELDAEGRVEIDGIVPGLTYKVVEATPPREGPFIRRADGRLPWYEEVLILAPVEGK